MTGATQTWPPEDGRRRAPATFRNRFIRVRDTQQLIGRLRGGASVAHMESVKGVRHGEACLCLKTMPPALYNRQTHCQLPPRIDQFWFSYTTIFISTDAPRPIHSYTTDTVR